MSLQSYERYAVRYQNSYTFSWNRQFCSITDRLLARQQNPPVKLATRANLCEHTRRECAVINIVEENETGFYWNTYKSKSRRLKKQYYHINPACELHYCEWCNNTNRVQEIWVSDDGRKKLCFACRMYAHAVQAEEEKLKEQLAAARSTERLIKRMKCSKRWGGVVDEPKPQDTRGTADKNTYLYRHYDGDKNLLYVGISLSVAARLAQHKAHSEWSPDIATVEVESYENRTEALAAEKAAIEKERPLWNKAYNFRRQYT